MFSKDSDGLFTRLYNFQLYTSSIFTGNSQFFCISLKTKYFLHQQHHYHYYRHNYDNNNLLTVSLL